VVPRALAIWTSEKPSFLAVLEIKILEISAFLDDHPHVLEEPGIDLGGIENLLDGPALFEGKA
jgi:hypothetical protein